ncbi:MULTISPECIES: DUF2141 domain-containing protein [unclassified Winogradskyella]|uniref:DUF2141 domain-containing protein n=1 Tax=unclassified Winogradskyella TaxID=2615021 RepID=UPI000B3CD84D|nr:MULTISPECIES: DUF2141 domain-containing protein [unclassified Winogradskyella]RZN76666.1 MAG: DUF2141 domain-containing protein [Winogradskyella sp.]
MSTLVKILIMLAIKAAFFGMQNVTSHDITVNISGLESNDGKILIGLYDEENKFLKDRFKDAIGEIDQEKSTITFTDIPEGTYAISFIHDENDNGKMDTNFMGIPKEDYGCSNNAKGFMGPPKWKDAKFELKSDKTIDITL